MTARLIVVSCLSKGHDVSKTDLFRANSIRVLSSPSWTRPWCRQMERFLKQAIVDKNPFIMASVPSAPRQQHVRHLP